MKNYLMVSFTRSIAVTHWNHIHATARTVIEHILGIITPTFYLCFLDAAYYPLHFLGTCGVKCSPTHCDGLFKKKISSFFYIYNMTRNFFEIMKLFQLQNLANDAKKICFNLLRFSTIQFLSFCVIVNKFWSFIHFSTFLKG